MKPLSSYLIKNFEKSTIDQIADDYREKGYVIKTDINVGPYRVDLAAIKGNEIVYIELKTHSEGPESKRRIKAMADYFRKIPNVKFLVVVSRMPQLKQIEFEEIESVLCAYFMLEIPSDLDALSTHAIIDDVREVNISEICIKYGDIHVVCNGIIEVIIQYGSDLEQEEVEKPLYMSFPFKFKGIINYDGNHYNVVECNDLRIDTDSYYK